MGKPKIRFKGYTTDWEQRKVSEITSSYSGGTPKAGTTEYYDGDIPFIRSGEIYGNTTELFITEEGLNSSSAKMVHIGDILYALYGATSGEVSRAKLDGAINQAILAITPNDEVNADFLVEWFRKEKTQITDKYLQGGQGNLSAQIIKDLIVTIPTCEEQNKIGEYFSKINHLITLHQRKYEEVKILKKYMLQKMFPQSGQKVPEIRFAGFTEEWEQHKLGEVATFINGRAYSQDELLSDGKYKVLRVGNFYTNDSWYFSDMELDEKYYANDGDLLYTWSATFGPHIWRGGKVIYHYHIWKIELSDILEKRFAVQLLEQDNAKILSDKNGSTMVHITKSGMEQKEVLLPSCVEEQAKIGAYFENLDHLITLHQQKCEELKNIKKFMLQTMFV